MNSLLNSNFLNCNTGINLLFQYTSTLFNLNLVTLFILILLSKGVGNTTLYLIMTTSIIYQTVPGVNIFINTSVPNIGLLNSISQYHPPLFFASTILLIVKVAAHDYSYLSMPTNLLLTSLLLSGWWANQELFWGSYWNWDPVEMSSIVLLLTAIFLLHFTKKKKKLSTTNGLNLITITTVILVTYTINRSDLANSVHKFSGTLLLNLDKPNLFIIKILILSMVVTTTKISQSNTHYQKLRPVLLITTCVTAAIIITTYLKLTEILCTQPQLFFKQAIMTSLTILYITRSKINRMLQTIPKYWTHLPIFLTTWCILFFKTPPTNNLFTFQARGVAKSQRISDLNLTKLIDGNLSICTYVRDFANKKKHQTTVLQSTSSTNLRIFRKINGDVYFINISAQDFRNTTWLALL